MAKQIVKIVLCSVAALLLTALLAGLLLLNATDLLPTFDLNDLGISFYDDTEYQIGNGELTVAQMRALLGLKIEWLGGKVDVRYYDGDTLRFSEPEEGLEENERLRWKMENGTLTILPCKKRLFSSFVCGDKTLEIQIPRCYFYDSPYSSELKSEWEVETTLNLDIQTASADIFLGELQIKALSIESASGNCCIENAWIDSFEAEFSSGSLTFTGSYADEVEILSVSGEILMQVGGFGALKLKKTSGDTTMENFVLGELDFESVSGDLRANLALWDYKGEPCIPDALRAETVSGTVTLTFAQDAAFTARLSSTSGSLTVDSDFGEVVSSDNGRAYTVNQGGTEFEFSSVSGNVHILSQKEE